MDDCHLRELAAAYVLGALEDAERERYEAHATTCAVCTREVDALRDSLLVLAHAGGAEAPAPDLRGRVIAAVQRESLIAPVQVRVARRRWALTFLPVAAAAAAAVVAVLLVTGGSSTPSELKALGRYSTVALRGAGGQRAGSVYVSLTGRTVALTSMPRAPQGKVYEAWVMLGGSASRAEPAGLFRGGRKQYVALTRTAHPGDVIGFTLERAGGSPRPTTSPLATARV